MIVGKDYALNALLRENYLPIQRKNREEIPPIFCTKYFTPDVAQELVKLNYRKVDGYSGYDQVEYKLTRFNSVSRLLSLPHPLPHAKLCIAFHENWDKLEYIMNNPSSQIKPHQYPDGRLVIMNGYSDCVEKANRQLKHAFGQRYRVNTDIANCFPSIYSHAVPWALVGLEEAKKKKPPKFSSEWFNQIDRHLRACRKDETQGIAIGPATSNIIAEIILARIDQVLKDKGFNFTRYIDDFICHCASEDLAEDFVRTVEREAGKFKLLLNIRKTAIHSLPQPTTEGWVFELGNSAPTGELLSSYDTFRFLDFAVSLSKSNPSGSVLKYAASMLANRKFKFGHDLEVLNYLLGLAFHHPDLLPTLTKLLDSSYLAFDGDKFDLSGASLKLEKIVSENSRLQRSDGMCWGLYYMGRVEAKISSETAKAIIDTGDAFAMLALYWTEQHQDAVVAFCKALDYDDLYLLDRYWILLYQLYLDEKIADPYADGVFVSLKSQGVTFLRIKENVATPKSVEEIGVK